MPGKHSFVSIVSSVFFLLGIVFIPFPFDLFPFQIRITDFLFGKLIGITADGLFGITLKDTKVYSDSVSMYILILLLLFIAVLLSVFFERIRKQGMQAEQLSSFVYKMGWYYLALQLLQYGLDKVFKAQFYLPEPNTLYTPLGQVSKDLLFWSSMGTSYGYTFFTGAAEVVAAVLIIFRRTRLLGLLAGFALLLHITAINFSFDISVKAYSCFLLLLSIYLLTPFINRLWQFFFTQESIPAVTKSNDYHLFKQPFVSIFFTSLFIGLVAVEAFYPYIKSGNFNDDLQQRPFLHGAYEVNTVTVGGDTVALASSPAKRFFIHRNGYLIFQNQQDEMQDYQLTYDTSHKLFILKDYQLQETLLRYNYSSGDSLLSLRYEKNGQEYQLTGRQLNWKELPVLKNEFHWTVDAPE